MLELAKKHIFKTLESLPSDALVLDVGGASAPFKRADFVVDAVDYQNIHWNAAKGPGEIRFTKDTYFKHDICSREPWPFKDKQFDFSTCSHVLEDIRDPIWVCSEMIRVSKAGYIEIPSRLCETTFGVEINKLSGSSHHRWVIDLNETGAKLRFTFKYMPVHSKIINKNKIKYDKNKQDMLLRLDWKNSFEYYENWLNSGKEIFEYYLSKPISEKELWRLYRKLSPKNFILAWLSYLKNTNVFFAKIFKNTIRKD